MRWNRWALPFVTAIAVLGTASAAWASPPPTSGTAPAKATPIAGLGRIVGNDIAAMSTCTVGGHDLLFIGGDFTGWIDHHGSHPVSRLIAVEQTSTDLVWTASGIGPSDSGWVQAVTCYPYDNGKQAMVYLGGSFTTVMGVARTHTAAIAVSTLSDGSLSYKLASWTIPTASNVRAIAVDASRTYVGGASWYRAVDHFTAKSQWVVRANCGVMALYDYDSWLFAGGFFTLTKGPGDTSWFDQYGAVSSDDTTGVLRKTFDPVITRNKAVCTDKTAIPHDKYTGSVPLSLTRDTKFNRVIIGMGGVGNRLGEANPTNGGWAWSRPMDGDIQTVSEYRGFVFAGHHRSGPNVGNYHFEDDEIGGFFAESNGAQAPWNPKWIGGGANRDHRNDGVIASVVIGDRLCAAGGFTIPIGSIKARGFACFAAV